MNHYEREVRKHRTAVTLFWAAVAGAAVGAALAGAYLLAVLR